MSKHDNVHLLLYNYPALADLQATSCASGLHVMIPRPCTVVRSMPLQVMANPVSTTGSGTDPGLWRNNVFVVNTDSATLYSASGCSASVSTTTTTSASAYQSTYSLSVGISGGYSGASFSANTDYKTMNSGTDANKAYTFVSGTIAQVAIGQLKSLSTIGMQLDPSFLQLVTQIRDSTGDMRTSLLQALYTGFGT